MTTIVTVLTEGFADWETALLNATARSYYKLGTHFATPGGAPVTSSGGMLVTPDLALETLDPEHFDALVICGGSSWQSDGAPDMTPIAAAARKAGKLIAGICDGTVALARTGLLDTRAHTSNGEGYLDGTGYAGKPHYRNVPRAVSDDGVITAPGTAPVTFMHEVLRALDVADDNLAYYVGMSAAEHAEAT